MKTASKILDNIRADDIEAAYGLFYAACQTPEFESAEAMAGRIYTLFHTSKDPVLQSYCYLFLGAVVDSGKLDTDACQKTADFLQGQLETLSDFRPMDMDGRFIHFINHMTFLAESLQPYIERTLLSEPLLLAYMRSDVQFTYNEDVVLAGYLLTTSGAFLSFAEILKTLTPVKNTSAENRISEANKKALWMSMFVLNEKLKLQDQTLFAPLVNSLAEHL